MKSVKNFMNKKYDKSLHQTLVLIANMFLVGNWVVQKQETYLMLGFWIVITLSFIESSRKKKE